MIKHLNSIKKICIFLEKININDGFTVTPIEARGGEQ
jgi:hypothetical protein